MLLGGLLLMLVEWRGWARAQAMGGGFPERKFMWRNELPSRDRRWVRNWIKIVAHLEVTEKKGKSSHHSRNFLLTKTPHAEIP